MRSSEKRVSAVAISNDGLFVCFADKFGVVWFVDLDGFHENQALAGNKAAPILAHYCSIITSLEFSPDGRFIISADLDFKIRVTLFPKKPLDGVHETQSFCLGHSEFAQALSIEHGRLPCYCSMLGLSCKFTFAFSSPLSHRHFSYVTGYCDKYCILREGYVDQRRLTVNSLINLNLTHPSLKFML